VSFRLDPRAEHVVADRIQIQQVLVNLIRNAVDVLTESPGRRELPRGRRLASSGIGRRIAELSGARQRARAIGRAPASSDESTAQSHAGFLAQQAAAGRLGRLHPLPT
jgi:hypothetical protein